MPPSLYAQPFSFYRSYPSIEFGLLLQCKKCPVTRLLHLSHEARGFGVGGCFGSQLQGLFLVKVFIRFVGLRWI